jgi:2-polyprenyl-3-methyl-5-hydroxy-6-metoxy-1,4-benzoquinol methylase
MNQKTYRDPTGILTLLFQELAYNDVVLKSPLRKVIARANEKAEHRTKAYWDANAARAIQSGDSYVDGAAQVEVRNAITASLVRSFAPGAKSAFDLGCGGGLLAVELARRGLTHYLGVDISETTIGYARTHIPERIMAKPFTLEFAVSDLATFQPHDPAQQFDLILFNEVLYYLPVETAFEQVKRYSVLLASGGLLGVSMYQGAKSKAIFRRLLTHFNWVTGFLYKECDRPSYGYSARDPYPSWLVTLLKPRV